MNNSFHIKGYQIISYSILIIVLLVSFFPFFWMISTSLMTLGETINRSVFPEKLQFVNYLTTWNDGKFSNYLLNSVLITLVSVTGLLSTSILSAGDIFFSIFSTLINSDPFNFKFNLLIPSIN